MKKFLLFLIALFLLSNTFEVNAIEQLNEFTSNEFQYNKHYEPGVHSSFDLASKNSLLISTVYVDDFGTIKSISVDQTINSDLYKMDSEGIIYKKIEGLTKEIPNAYRKVTTSDFVLDFNIDKTDLILQSDLVFGNNDEDIEKLNNYDSFVLKSSVDEKYRENMSLLTEKIVKDNSIYGIDLVIREQEAFVNNIEGLDIPVTKEILNLKKLLDSLETNSVDFSSTKSKLNGVYSPGTYSFNLPIFENETINSSKIDVFVNEWGRIEYFNYDEISLVDGIISTRSYTDENYKEQFKLLNEAVILNQSVNSFELVDSENNKIDNITSIDEAVYISKIDSYTLESNQIYTNIKSALDSINSFKTIKLTNGVHYNSRDNYFMSILIKDNLIVDMTIDEVFPWDTASISNEKGSFLLYKYTKFIDYTYEGDVILEDFVIYGDGNKFYSKDGTDIVFDSTVIDERSTVIAISGNLTMQNTNIVNNDLNKTYNKQTDILISYLIEQFNENRTIFNLNILKDGVTDTLNEFELKVEKYQQLFIDTLKNSIREENIFNDTSVSKTQSMNVNISSGRFYGVSEFPTVDENFFIVSLTIDKDINKKPYISSVVLDETVYNEGVLTTKNSLLNELYFVREDNRDNFSGYFEVSRDISNMIYTDGVIEQAFNEAISSVELKDLYKKDFEGIKVDISAYSNIGQIANKYKLDYSYVSDYLSNFNSAISSAINKAIKNTYLDVIEDFDEQLRESENKIIVVDNLNQDEIVTKLTNMNDALNTFTTYIDLDSIKFTSENNLLRLKYDKKNKELLFEASDRIKNVENVKVEVTYRFDHYDAITKEYNFKISPKSTFFNDLLKNVEVEVGFYKDDKFTNRLLYDTLQNVLIKTNFKELLNDSTNSDLSLDLIKFDNTTLDNDGNFVISNLMLNSEDDVEEYNIKLYVDNNEEDEIHLLGKYDSKDISNEYTIEKYNIEGVEKYIKKSIDVNTFYNIYNLDNLKTYLDSKLAENYIENANLTFNFIYKTNVITKLDKLEDRRQFFDATFYLNSNELFTIDYTLGLVSNDEIIESVTKIFKDIYVDVYRNLEDDEYTKDDHLIDLTKIYEGDDFEYTILKDGNAINYFDYSKVNVKSKTYKPIRFDVIIVYNARKLTFTHSFDIILYNNLEFDYI